MSEQVFELMRKIAHNLPANKPFLYSALYIVSLTVGWMVEEQVVIAGLDCFRLDVAEPCLISINEQFPGSLRVRKLKAMRLEALER